MIALSDPPTTWHAHDYGLRWGIEANLTLRNWRPRQRQ
jgi:hypothetical protein